MDTRQQFRIMLSIWIKLLIFLLISVLSPVHATEEDQVDTHEGSNVILKCRFPPVLQNATSFWLTHTNNDHDNAAIDNTSLSPNYKVYLNLTEGRYDLEIRNVSYELNNGKYECRIKDSRSGYNLHHKNVTLTVLRAPGPPHISPTSTTATEGSRLELRCNTEGGSPEPDVTWYRDNSRSLLHRGRILEMVPTRNDDGAILRCVVRNRAMPEGQTLNASIQLDVNYFPRVSVGPANPLKVEANTTAVLKCNVDSKPGVSRVRWIKDGKSFIATTFEHTIHRVTLQDAGKYTCEADNYLSSKGEASLYLDVLYPPTVFIEGDRIRIAEVDDTITVHCNVTANPKASIIEWTSDERPEFRQSGPLLRLSRVTADHAANYSCRAVNTMHPTGGQIQNHSASARVTIRIRHKPGPAKVTPDSPVAVENSRVILTCNANPPGYPEPQYKWWKEGEDDVMQLQRSGSQFVINSVNLGSDGVYKCHAMNEVGTGEAASVTLTVHQQPKILSKLNPHVTRTVGESSFEVTCVAQGKPRPVVRWLKSDEELTANDGLYKVETFTSVGHGNVSIVNSTLSFLGHNRPHTDEIIASDRGKYKCVFHNEVKKVESEMLLKVEHPPIVLHKHNKVAYNLRETAEVTCQVQAWPKPEFHWKFGSNSVSLQGSSSDGHYEIWTTNEQGDDIYTSILKITNIRELDYNNYSCHAINDQGITTSVITLQPKGAPEKPTNLSATYIGPNYVTLQWEIGFDGGIPITKYFVSYRRIPGEDDTIAPDCASPRSNPPGQWSERDCGRNNPCNITDLDQHRKYAFKVKAYNTKNHSDYSEEKIFTTTVAKIPAPQRVSFDPESGSLVITAGPTCLSVVAFIERFEGGSNDPWRIVNEWPLEVLGSAPTTKDGILDDPETSHTEPRLRVRLCLQSDKQKCGEYTEAETQAGALATPTLIALVVSGAVFLLFAALLLLFCRCRRKHAAKAKDYEMDSNTVRPSLVTGNGQQTQAPPPYYAENKALEHSLDRALAMEDSKTPAYAQPGYNWRQPNHNINGENGVNMGYLDNSYSNSNNGGSVNSQDSIWQMKSAAANGANPPYDLGGYAPTESDYPTHPHYLPQREDYRENHNLSRQQFCPEPFATVVKSQKHVDSPYDVSGLPYQEAYDEDTKPPQQVSLSYDESLESGYSTPNGRRPRIIREIIV
ncbi:hemicentin-1 isoform X2 [Chelonus insularis]|uniref:hemicentin-1 isoform X2 n=1 Tax=Chelonus insularis TaxID=460826 RepID=UPI00158AC047|nr:hemicentin-1 isoform X2 [Chelonus insularis]